MNWQTLHANQLRIGRLKLKRRQLPSLPSPPLPVPLLSLPSTTPPFFSALPASGFGGALWAPPVGSGAKPQPLNNLVHIEPWWQHFYGFRIKTSSVFWSEWVSQFCRQLAWTTNKIWLVWWEALCWWEAWGPGPLPPLNPALVISVFDSILLSFLSVQNQWLAWVVQAMNPGSFSLIESQSHWCW